MAALTIYNLTDVETPQLKARGLVNQQLIIGRLNLAPGESGTTEDDPMTREHLAGFTRVGAAALNGLPPAYTLAREKAQQARRAAAAREKALAEGRVGGK